jgi:hypothetical protein
LLALATGDGVDQFAEHHLSSRTGPLPAQARSAAKRSAPSASAVRRVATRTAPGGDKDEACANAGLAKISERLN